MLIQRLFGESWREYITIIHTVVFSPEPEYLVKKFNDHFLFVKVAIILFSLVTMVSWGIAIAVDPDGAQKSFFLWLVLVLMPVPIVWTLNYVKTERIYFLVFLVILIVLVPIALEVLSRHTDGMVRGVGVFASFYLTSFVLLQVLSLPHIVMYTLLATSYPHLVAFAGLAPGFQHELYANIIWPTAVACIIAHCIAEINYRKRYLAETILDVISKTDPLTSLCNRGHFMEHLEQELQRARRSDQSVSLLMMDIDHFKKINDSFGHPIGDQVLQIVGNLLKETVRQSDVSGRLGGEEFGVLLPASPAHHALTMAERIRVAIEKSCIPMEEGEIQFTCSIGVSALNAIDTVDSWISRTDRALYQAKNTGRNRVVLGNPELDEMA